MLMTAVVSLIVSLMGWFWPVLLYMGTDGPLYAFSLFLPSIINQVSDVSSIATMGELT